MLFHHLYLFPGCSLCHPLKFGLIRACNKDCMGSGEGWERCAVTQSLRCFQEAGGLGEGACLGGVAFPCCLRTVGEAGVGEGGARRRRVLGAWPPTAPDPDGRGGGGEEEAKGVSGAGHVLPRGRSRRWRTPRGRRGVSRRGHRPGPAPGVLLRAPQPVA